MRVIDLSGHETSVKALPYTSRSNRAKYNVLLTDRLLNQQPAALCRKKLNNCKGIK
jgi:hypothetical protein